jgi:hypothetical protein
MQQFFYCCDGNVFTEPLPSNGRGLHIQTHRLMGFVKYALEMGSGAIIHIPYFIKIGSAIQKLIRGKEYTDTKTRRHHGDLISRNLFFQNK